MKLILSSRRLCEGSAFIEVVIALAMIAFGLTSIFYVSGSLMARIANASSRLKLILPLKHSFYLEELDTRDLERKELPLPVYCAVGSVICEHKQVSPESIFSRFEYMTEHRASTLLQTAKKEYEGSLFLLHFFIPKEKKEMI